MPLRKVATKHKLAYQHTLWAAAKAARECGEVWTVTSSYRSYAEQLALWNAYRNGTGNLAARPGTSKHELGLAIDIANVGDSLKRRKALAKYGLCMPVASEKWHVEQGNQWAAKWLP